MANWTKARSGNFNNANGWSTGSVPGAGDAANITASGAAFTVTATTNEDVDSLRVGANATLVVKGGGGPVRAFTVENGTGAGLNLGVIQVGQNASLEMVARTAVQFANKGVISLNAGGKSSVLDVQSRTGAGGGLFELTGGGSIVMSDNANNAIEDTFVGKYENIRIENRDNTLSGAGVIGNGSLAGGGEITFINQGAGVIDATGQLNALILDLPSQGAVADLVNAGLIEATGAAGLAIVNTTVANSGTILAAAGSIVRLEGAQIVGGTLINAAGGQIIASGHSGEIGTNLVNQGVFIVAPGDSFSAGGSIINSGTINLFGPNYDDGHLVTTGNLTLSGGGLVNLGKGGTFGDANGVTIVNVDNKILGGGLLGVGAAKVVNGSAGVIESFYGTGLWIGSRRLTNEGLVSSGQGQLEVAGAIANSGMIEALTSGFVTLDKAVDNTGVLESDGGVFVASKDVTGDGIAVITGAGSGGVLSFGGDFSEDVFFTGLKGTLILAHSRSYTGSISGFSASGGASLNLHDIHFVSAGEATFTGTVTGGTLTVTDGTNTAHIALVGDYLNATFTTSRNVNGGVAIVATTPAPHAFVAAMAGLGGATGAAIASPPDHAGAAPILMAPPR